MCSYKGAAVFGLPFLFSNPRINQRLHNLSCWVAIDLRTNLNKSHLTNNHSPGSGFKYFSLLSFSTPTCGDDPIWLIVFRWVGTTSNLALEVKYLDVKESNLHGLQLEISDTDRMGGWDRWDHGRYLTLVLKFMAVLRGYPSKEVPPPKTTISKTKENLISIY